VQLPAIPLTIRDAWSGWARHLSCKQEIGVQLPAVPLKQKMGLWSKGMTPVWHAGNPGSIPGGSTRVCRVVDGRGVRSPNIKVRPTGVRFAPRCHHPHDDRTTDGSRIWLGRAALLTRLPHYGHEGSNPSPSAESALVVKRTIIPRFERGVPGSNPGWGTLEEGMRDEG
jgi:hypothetical protein